MFKNELKEEKVETVIPEEEFQVSEEIPAAEASESVPVFATSLLGPSSTEQEGILNVEVKVRIDSPLFQYHSLRGEGRKSSEAQETPSNDL